MPLSPLVYGRTYCTPVKRPTCSFADPRDPQGCTKGFPDSLRPENPSIYSDQYQFSDRFLSCRLTDHSLLTRVSAECLQHTFFLVPTRPNPTLNPHGLLELSTRLPEIWRLSLACFLIFKSCRQLMYMPPQKKELHLESWPIPYDIWFTRGGRPTKQWSDIIPLLRNKPNTLSGASSDFAMSENVN